MVLFALEHTPPGCLFFADGGDGPSAGLQDCYQGMGGEGYGHHPRRRIHMLLRWRGT